MTITDCLTDHVAQKACLCCRVVRISLANRLHSLFFLKELLEFVLLIGGVLLSDLIRKVDTVAAAFDPRGFGHGGIDLLQIELALNAIFVDIGYHVGWLNERHREAKTDLYDNTGQWALL